MATNLPPVPGGFPDRDEKDQDLTAQLPPAPTQRLDTDADASDGDVDATRVRAAVTDPDAKQAADEAELNEIVAEYDANQPADGGKGSRKHAAKKGHPFLWGLLGGVVGAGLLGAAGYIVLDTAATKTVSSTAVSASSGNVLNITSDTTSADTAEVVAAKCLPSVASITVESSDGEGVGSGVVLDTSGNILTNYHVIEGAQTIVVSLNGENYDGTVVGYDSSSDLAVVRIDPDGATLTPIEVGDSDSLIVGQWVMSIGSPFGFDQSVTQGIVSSMYRSTIMSDTSGNTIYTNLIQTDAAINPGNSGGALVDAEGKLIGINSLIESTSGSSSGVGFAIPSNYAVKVANTIIAGKTVEHAYLGATVRSVTPEFASVYRLSTNTGAYIETVTDGSPAAEAGLQQGDVVTAIDGEAVTGADSLILAIRSHDVGDEVELTYYRGSKESTIKVTLGSDGTDTNVSGQPVTESGSDSDSSDSGSGYGNGYGYNFNGGSGGFGSR